MNCRNMLMAEPMDSPIIAHYHFKASIFKLNPGENEVFKKSVPVASNRVRERKFLATIKLGEDLNRLLANLVAASTSASDSIAAMSTPVTNEDTTRTSKTSTRPKTKQITKNPHVSTQTLSGETNTILQKTIEEDLVIQSPETKQTAITAPISQVHESEGAETKPIPEESPVPTQTLPLETITTVQPATEKEANAASCTQCQNDSFRVSSTVDEITKKIASKKRITKNVKRKATFSIFKDENWIKVYSGVFEVVGLNKLQALVWARDQEDKILLRILIEENRGFVCQDNELLWNDQTENKQIRKLAFANKLNAIEFFLHINVYVRNNQKKTGNRTDANNLLLSNIRKDAILQKRRNLKNKWDKELEGSFEVIPFNESEAVLCCKGDIGFIESIEVIEEKREFVLEQNELFFYSHKDKEKKVLKFYNKSDAQQFHQCICFYLEKSREQKSKCNQIENDSANEAVSYRLSSPVDELTKKIIDSYENNPFARITQKEAMFSVFEGENWVNVYNGVFEIVQLDDLQAVVWAKDRDNQIVFRMVIEESRRFVSKCTKISWIPKNENANRKRKLVFDNEQDASNFYKIIRFYIENNKKEYLEHRNRFPLVKRAQFNNVDVEVSIKMYRNPIKLLYLLEIGEIQQILTPDMNFRANDNCRILTWNGFDATTKEVGQFELNFSTLEERNAFYGIIKKAYSHIRAFKEERYSYHRNENNLVFTANCNTNIPNEKDRLVALVKNNDTLIMLIFESLDYKNAKFKLKNIYFDLNLVISANSEFTKNEDTITFTQELEGNRNERKVRISIMNKATEFYDIVRNHIVELNENRRMY